MRVFAGPNGSGKSTIIQAVKDYRIKEIPVDFGIYINADDIANELRMGTFSFSDYEVFTTREEFIAVSLESGLVGTVFPERLFKSSFKFQKNMKLKLVDYKADERIAQIVSHFLRKKLLNDRRKFSFETVFSHSGKLDIMREANKLGYRVYLYFVSTESPDINIYRVQLRKDKGGHDVPPEKIKSRYERSLDLMFDAAQLAYQTYFFDNSKEQPKLFAHFKMIKKKKKWGEILGKEVPEWFKKYYSNKIIPNRKLN